MRVKALRQILWVANTLLVLGIVAYALFFFILGGVRKQGIQSPENLLTKRNLPEAAPDVKTDKVLPFETYQVIHQIVIDGDLPPEAVESGPSEAVREIPPLAQDYNLLWVAASTPDPLSSFAHLEHKSSKKVLAVQVGEFVEYVRTGAHGNGDWKLVGVSANSPWTAEFARDGSGERVVLEQVRKNPSELGKGPIADPKEIGEVDGPGVGRVRKQPRERPTRELVALPGREDEFSVPPEEQAWWGDYGEDELSKKVALETAKVDGRAVGLMFKSVEKDSMLERRGVKSGDLLRSINGKAVSTRQEVVNYLNHEGKDLTRYEVVMERDGKEIRKVYHVRPKRD